MDQWHFATLWESLSDTLPDRDAVVCGSRRVTWRQWEERSARLASAFQAAGLGVQSKIGLYLYNGIEYTETQFAAFAETVDDFVEFERNHARMEGVEVMPKAKETFTADDWAGVEAAFSSNDDPVFGQKPRQRFDALYRKIVALAPSPMGYADREVPKKAEPEADKESPAQKALAAAKARIASKATQSSAQNDDFDTFRKKLAARKKD